MVKVNIIGHHPTEHPVIDYQSPAANITVGPEGLEVLSSTVIQIISVIVTGVVAIVLKQNLFPH